MCLDITHSANDGENPNRNWGLVIVDITADADSGVLNRWSLTFSGTPAKSLISHPTCPS